MATHDRHAPLSPRQIRDLWRTLGAEYHAEARERSQMGRAPGKLPRGQKRELGRVRDRIGDVARRSGRAVEKCLQIYKAAEQNPALFGPVVEYLERSENISDAYNRMRRIADLERARRLAPIAGRFATLVLDPPWEDESVSENQRPPYATMPLDAIAAVPVPAWAFDQAHIYVHAPGPFVPIAVGLVQGWGFAFKTILVWQKSRISQGRYFRTLDEFVVFGTRGGLMTARQDVSNHFTGLVGQHSEKPDAFYDLVRAASPPPYGEAFQRKARDGFANLYAPAALPAAAE